jgi:dTDP-4-dehydrorhamnose reductase
MRILISGFKGMVGNAVCKSLRNHKLILPTKAQLNIGNLEQVMRFKSVDLIIHLAGETDHEYCEQNPSNCYYVNTVGTGNMVRLARTLDIPMVYLSTASVFDGTKGSPYTPFDPPNPINHYNTSKWYGELLTQAYKKHYILRAGWMFGGGQIVDKKFVNKIFWKIKAGEKKIKVCDDCIGSPTYTKDLANVIKSIIESKHPYGTYNCVNKSNGVSRFEFAKAVIKYLGLTGRVKIIPCKIDDLKEEFPCKRTNYEVLQNNFSLMRDWEVALKEYISADYRH